MDDEQTAAYDRGRDLSAQPHRSLCYAPSASMYFDVRGNAIACCQNTTNILGNVNDMSLRDIWHGERAVRMRDQLTRYEFPDGCDFCEWDVKHGSLDGVFARLFDQRATSGPDPEWPTMMEFALSNRCNLACVMCNGDFSSTIRHREGRKPLPSRYGDQFFEELNEFLPHLEMARFFGGEPFLIPEYARIWDQMIKVSPGVECNVTTNGTIRTPRVEATLDDLRFSIGVSVDGMSRETVERVRSGADYGVVMDNVRWFHAYCARQETGFCLTYCLMTHNWEEFGDFLQFADDLDTTVAVNTVVYPPESSLYQLAGEELADVVLVLEQQRDRVARHLGRNEEVWHQQLDRLHAWSEQLAARGRGEQVDGAYFEQWGTYQGPDLGPSMGPSRGPSQGPSQGPSHGPATPVPVTLRESADTPESTSSVEEARRILLERTGVEPDALVVSAENIVTHAEGAGDCFVGIPTSMIIDRSFEATLVELDKLYGIVVQDPPHQASSNMVERDVLYSDGIRETRLLCATVVESDGDRFKSTTFAVVEGSGDAPS